MALSVTFSNIDSFDGDRSQLVLTDKPVFEQYTEDIAALREQLRPYDHFQNILLVGNGGSIWSLMTYYTALSDRVNGKTVVPLTDMEPDYLEVVKQKYPKESSLVLVISKSGSTVGAIENLLALSKYQQLYVTDLESPLGQIGQKLNVPIIKHPPVGGRYSGFTSCAYVPAILAGLPVEEIERGGREGYAAFGDPANSDNQAAMVALALYQLDQQGYGEIFLPIYSNFLQTFGMQVTQLFHESFGKEGKGMTVVAVQAPESQHHTNQRFFGGRKNMVGCFLRAKNQRTQNWTLTVPAELQDIPLRSGKLGDIDGLNLAKSFEAEYIGTVTDAKQQNIPVIDIAVDQVDSYHVGLLLAFWHYVTVYSSVLRGVDPYDQPQVEASKVISFNQRLA